MQITAPTFMFCKLKLFITSTEKWQNKRVKYWDIPEETATLDLFILRPCTLLTH